MCLTQVFAAECIHLMLHVLDVILSRKKNQRERERERAWSVPTHRHKQIFANVLTFNQLQVPALTGVLVSVLIAI